MVNVYESEVFLKFVSVHWQKVVFVVLLQLFRW